MRKIKAIKEANQAASGTFFDRRTISFFKAKVLPTVYGGKYFITSDVLPSSDMGPVDKRYSVREALPTGLIKLVGERHAYPSKSTARAAIREMLNGLVTA